MNDLSQRIQAAAESIINNEAISDGLDDEAAQTLIAWGVERAKQIAATTVELDARAAEEALYQPLRALRKLLRATRQWALNPEAGYLETIVAQVPTVYDHQSRTLDEEQQMALLAQPGADPIQRIQLLRAWIEG